MNKNMSLRTTPLDKGLYGTVVNLTCHGYKKRAINIINPQFTSKINLIFLYFAHRDEL